MNKANHLRSIICFLLIFSLFLSTGSRIFSQNGVDVDRTHFAISNHSGVATAESQLPFEEKEEKGQDHSLFDVDAIPFGFQPFLFSYTKKDLVGGVFLNDHGRLPLYLAKRALLI